MAAAASSASSSASHVLPALHHALNRLSIATPRLIPSPATQPRRASVAIIVRVRPSTSDDEYLSRQYDAEGLPLPGSDVDRILTQSGLGLQGHGSAKGNDSVATAVNQVGSPPPAQSNLRTSPSTSSLATLSTPPPAGIHSTLSSFFSLPWVQRGTPEILYIKRATRPTDKWSAHVAFPGGRRDDTDEDALYTAMRETWEEVGLDLADRDFVHVGQLDDREITSSLGKRLLMVLSPFVFLQTTPFSHQPELQPTEVASAHWVPLSHLYTPRPDWGTVSIDISTRLAPKSRGVRLALQSLLGKMDFRCILLPNDPWAIAGEEEEDDPTSSDTTPSAESQRQQRQALRDARRAAARAKALHNAGLPDDGNVELKLWGLTLGMTIDVLAHMSTLPGSEDPATASNLTATSATQSTLHGKEAGQTRPHVASILSTFPQPSRLPSIARSVATKVRDELHLNPPPLAGAKAPSLTSVFPRFSNADVNFWIWIFGYRYRRVIRAWESCLGTPQERRFNWSGMALGSFYSAVRRALIVALLLRALGAVGLLGGGAWLAARRVGRWSRGEKGWGLAAKA